MNIADSFYVALCMTVLLLGVVYWFWTQTQYLQRKINLLENIVYELKTSIDHGTTGGPPPSDNGANLGSLPMGAPQEAFEPQGPRLEISSKPVYPPAPGSELGEDEDLLHETLLEESDGKGVAAPVAEPVSGTSLADTSVPEDLRPGGVGSGLSESVVPSGDAQRPRASVLDGMTLKELRRLGEQRNIPGASTLRKQALIDMLRAEVKVGEKAVEKAPEETTAAEAPVALRPFEDSVIEHA